MAVKVKCEICKRELDQPGAIVISPPDEDGVVQHHNVCKDCYEGYSKEESDTILDLKAIPEDDLKEIVRSHLKDLSIEQLSVAYGLDKILVERIIEEIESGSE